MGGAKRLRAVSLAMLPTRNARSVPLSPFRNWARDRLAVESLEKVPCVCGKGFLEVKSTLYGKWRVDTVVTACNTCGSDDIAKAREEQAKKEPAKKEPTQKQGQTSGEQP